MRARLLALGLAVLCGSAPRADAQQIYHRTQLTGRSLCVFWPGREYVYRLDAAGLRTPGGAEFAAIEAAVESWRAVSATCSDYTFRRGPDISEPQVGYDEHAAENENVITFRNGDCNDLVPPGDPCIDADTCGNAYACWEHGSGIIGLTTSTFSLRTGKLFDADIEFNAAGAGGGFHFTTADSPPCDAARSADCVITDVQNTVTHELGHVVGLDHVPEQLGSTMEPSAPLGETQKRIIDTGSAMGFCSIYPRGLPPTQCNEDPELGLHSQAVVHAPGAGCAAAPGTLWPLLGGLLGVRLGAGARGRRRGRRPLGRGGPSRLGN